MTRAGEVHLSAIPPVEHELAPKMKNVGWQGNENLFMPEIISGPPTASGMPSYSRVQNVTGRSQMRQRNAEQQERA